VAFIEYVLWKYQKTLPQLFTPPPGGVANAALLRALDEAIAQYQATRAAVCNTNNTDPTTDRQRERERASKQARVRILSHESCVLRDMMWFIQQRAREEELKHLEEASKAPRSVASVQAANKRDELAGQEFAQVCTYDGRDGRARCSRGGRTVGA
jgi:hypothetical protein